MPDSVNKVLATSVQSQNQSLEYYIPSWIKNDANWWTDGEIGDSDFINIMQYLIDKNIVIIPPTTLPASSSSSQEGIPIWIKNNTKSWADGKADDLQFISGIQFMIENKIIQISMANSEDTLTHPQIILFTPNPTSDLLSMLNNHVDSNDMVDSFNPRVLNAYSNIQRILLAYSIDNIQQAISIAQSNSNPILYIGYDNEANNGKLSTPDNEIQDPGRYTNMAADLVHQANYKFAATPTAAILMQEYKQVDWSKVDLLIMQLQKATKDQESFTSTVNQIASYARAENPHILIFVQINPSFNDSITLAGLISQVSYIINGTSIVVPGAMSPSIIDDLLTKLGR